MRKAIGIDIGGTYIKAGITDENGNILTKQQFPTMAEKGSRDIVLQQIETAIEFAMGELDEPPAGIGIGTPGVVDNEGVVFEAPNLPDWHNLPLKKIFSEKYNLPVVVENDVNSITWGEFLYGAGKGYNTIICITLGTGVGGGIVKDGKLIRGSRYSAVEIGHIPIEYKGPQCKCGNYGCVERFVGRDYIVERAVKAIKEGKKTFIYELAEGMTENITPKLISVAYKKGDRVATDIWIDVGVCLGALFSGLVNLLNPELIVIGGGISQNVEVMFETIEKTIKERAMRILAENVKVVQSSLGTDAGIISAGALLFQK
ncbi:MAG: ROK family protein [Candidatus Ratteibacteria bacterium]|nr:ROK family protein [Candidatus Ratteibacteria bacterium]